MSVQTDLEIGLDSTTTIVDAGQLLLANIAAQIQATLDDLVDPSIPGKVVTARLRMNGLIAALTGDAQRYAKLIEQKQPPRHGPPA